jgi:hypothetical protein
MTDEQINAAIARVLNADEHWMIRKNYCGDLNAMHEAEKMLTPTQIEDYIIEVMQFSHEPIIATARQRAEAFLRTLGKWEEGGK